MVKTSLGLSGYCVDKRENEAPVGYNRTCGDLQPRSGQKVNGEGPGDSITAGGRALPNWPDRAHPEGRLDDHWGWWGQASKWSWQDSAETGPCWPSKDGAKVSPGGGLRGSLDEVCRKEALLRYTVLGMCLFLCLFLYCIYPNL